MPLNKEAEQKLKVWKREYGRQRKNQDHPDYGTVKISQNTK